MYIMYSTLFFNIVHMSAYKIGHFPNTHIIHIHYTHNTHIEHKHAHYTHFAHTHCNIACTHNTYITRTQHMCIVYVVCVLCLWCVYYVCL